MKIIDIMLFIATVILLGAVVYIFTTDAIPSQILADSKEIMNNLLNPSKNNDNSNVKTEWSYIIIHHSGTNKGDMASFDKLQRKNKNLKEGLIYHFVIGNGTFSNDGEIEEGPRWNKKLPSPQTTNKKINTHAIGICLVGNFNKYKPTRNQINSLISLLKKLCKEYYINPTKIFLHSQIDKNKTTCPGKFISIQSLRKAITQ